MTTTVPFAVSKKLLGSKSHIIVNETGAVSMADAIPSTIHPARVYGTKPFNEAAAVYGAPVEQVVPIFPPVAFQKAYRELFNGVPHHPPPWSVCIPYKAYKQTVRQLLKGVREVVNCYLDDLSYYDGVYQTGKQLLERLRPVYVDVDKWQRYMSSDEGSAVVSSFKPVNKRGECREVLYDRAATVTGRLKVVDGPNILNLKREHRSMLRSRFGDKGSLWYLDYSSLEPRVLLALTKDSRGITNNGTLPKEERQERDIYQYVLNHLFPHNEDEVTHLTRSDIKEIILSEVYGAGMNSLLKRLSHLNESSICRVVSVVEQFFELPQFKEKLRQEASTTSHCYLTTPYGRKVSIHDAAPYMYVNRVVQSTAVDVSLLGFNSVVELITELGKEDEVVPVFVLHDALIVDVHENSENIIPGLCKVGREVPLFEGTSFYIKAEKLVQGDKQQQ